MDALLIRGDHLRALTAIFHHKFLAVAGAAGRRDVGVVHLRFRVARGQQLVRATVTVDAGGGVDVASLDGLAVEAAIVRALFVGVAGGT